MTPTRNDLGERDHQADSVDCCDESDALSQIDIFIIPRPSYQSAIIIIMMMMMMPPGQGEQLVL